MSNTLSAAIFGALVLVGASLVAVPSASAAPVAGLTLENATQVQNAQYERRRHIRRKRVRRPRCTWERRRVKTGYGWRTRRVRVCRRGYY